ncbi:group III truncated hemoglobin [uncultured Chitinophaga sp.]|uniref:group III truncated hemoglobin n=1 Tax=uncultured Chitinophaga sp. TaxID=339340 RepID=UPI0025F8497A|nr:group III truncated hemoglobin [uncultured Chitinophaga sp.]
MKDITTKEDIALIVRAFYKKATIDPLIGHFFTTVKEINWNEHIPLITSFWENILLGGTDYKGGAMFKHIQLNRLSPMERGHFERWLALWGQTVKELYAGPTADEAIRRADSIAGIMQFKVSGGR